MRVDQRDGPRAQSVLQVIDAGLNLLDVEVEATGQSLGVVVGTTALSGAYRRASGCSAPKRRSRTWATRFLM